MGLFSRSSSGKSGKSDKSGESKNLVKAIGSSDLSTFRSYLTDMHYNLNKIEALEKPVICAINKYVAGMGLEIALTADFRIATKMHS